MGRDFSYRVLFKGVRPPADAEELLNCECGYWGGEICSECINITNLFKEYASDWMEYTGIGRYNSVLGYEWCDRILTKRDVQDQISEWKLQMATTDKVDDMVDAIRTFRFLEDCFSIDGMAIEIDYS